jgi:phosphohistidine phosphatase SixA
VSVVLTRAKGAKVYLRTMMVCTVTALMLAAFDSGAEDSRPQAGAGEKSYVALLRHGDAPGRNEPRNFDLSDCSTQRNLSDEGRNEARQLGETLRGRGLSITKVLSSRWCRANETAALLKMGPVENDPAFDNLDFNKHRSTALIDRERELIASWRGPGVLLIVTHSSNIKVLTGLDAEQGTMVVANPPGESNPTLRFGKVSIQDASSYSFNRMLRSLWHS